MTTNMARVVYSRRRKADAPSWTALPISFMASVPWSSFRTRWVSDKAKIRASAPVAMAMYMFSTCYLLWFDKLGMSGQ